MRVDGVGGSPPAWWTSQILGQVMKAAVSGASPTPQTTVLDKDTMEKLLNAAFYNQFGIADKLARIASEFYAKFNSVG